jgi:hypothetical protein
MMVLSRGFAVSPGGPATEIHGRGRCRRLRQPTATLPAAAVFSQPLDLMNDIRGSALGPAIVGIHGLRPADRGVREIFGALLGDEQFDILRQRSLVAFQPKDHNRRFYR